MAQGAGTYVFRQPARVVDRLTATVVAGTDVAPWSCAMTVLSKLKLSGAPSRTQSAPTSGGPATWAGSASFFAQEMAPGAFPCAGNVPPVAPAVVPQGVEAPLVALTHVYVDQQVAGADNWGRTELTGFMLGWSVAWDVQAVPRWNVDGVALAQAVAYGDALVTGSVVVAFDNPDLARWHEWQEDVPLRVRSRRWEPAACGRTWTWPAAGRPTSRGPRVTAW